MGARGRASRPGRGTARASTGRNSTACSSGALDDHQRRHHRPRRLHAHPLALVRRAVARADRQHPPVAAAEVPGPRHPRARHRGRRQGRAAARSTSSPRSWTRAKCWAARRSRSSPATPPKASNSASSPPSIALPPRPGRVRPAMTDLLDRVRRAALELPGTEERLSHGQPTFFVAGKQFAQFRDNHHGDGKTVVCVRVSGLDEQAMLLEADPATYSKPAYLPSWVSINLAGEARRLGPCRRPHRGKLGACGAAAIARSRRAMTDDENPPPLDQFRRADRARRAGRSGARRVDRPGRAAARTRPTRVVEQHAGHPADPSRQRRG